MCYPSVGMVRIADRAFIHLSERRLRLVDPGDVYYFEAEGGDTFVRLRGSRRVRDIRDLASVGEAFERFGFVRIHRSYIVNARRIAELRRRTDRDWELRLEPPVHRVLPVGRTYLRRLRAAFDAVP